jgi:hypothetical protein
MKVESKVTIYEVAGSEPALGADRQEVTVKSHWNRDEFVVLEVPGALAITVAAADLKRAIDNAGNWR